MTNRTFGAKTGKSPIAPHDGAAEQQELLSGDIDAQNPNVVVAVDRPGFDLGGSTGKTVAGAGVGLGPNSSENSEERSLPGRHTEPVATIPRWSGPDGTGVPPAFKSLLPKKS